MERNPSRFSPAGLGRAQVKVCTTDDLPVESVSYDDAVEFCRRLSARSAEQARGRVYRLPTEAEWEYACRAGTETLFHTGDTLSSNQANFDGRYPIAGARSGPFLRRTEVAGTYQTPNGFGLHDMHGNVAEWCHDWFAADGYAQNGGPLGPAEGTQRVVRGGHYYSPAYQCRSCLRTSRPPGSCSPQIGFRVVMEEHVEAQLLGTAVTIRIEGVDHEPATR
jgi:formylglycine-generating enzyme required for sulfatase activity